MNVILEDIVKKKNAKKAQGHMGSLLLRWKPVSEAFKVLYGAFITYIFQTFIKLIKNQELTIDLFRLGPFIT